MKAFKRLGIIALVLIMLIVMAACKKDNTETSGTTPAATTTKAPDTATTEPTDTTEPTEPEEKQVTQVDAFTTFPSIGENDGWQSFVNSFGEGRTGKQYVSFSVTPLIDNVDGSISFADAEKEVAGFNDVAMMIRMNAEGIFDAGNGDNYEKLADVAYEANGIYFVEVYADMNAKIYSVYVTPDGGEPTLIAENYAFRTSANDADDLGQVFFVSAGGSDQFSVDYIKRLEIYDPAKAYLSTGENFGWQSKPIKLAKEYTGKIKIEFDMTSVIDSVDGSVDFTDGAFDVFGFGDLAMLNRMKIDGAYFDARNDAIFEKIAEVLVVKDNKNHIEVVADIDAKTYSVWVTIPGGTKTQIAKDFSFRDTAKHADSIGQCFVISAHEDDSIKMENLVITELNDDGTPAPTTTAAPTTPAAQPGTTTTKSSGTTTTTTPSTTAPTTPAPTTSELAYNWKKYTTSLSKVYNLADTTNVGPHQDTTYLLPKVYKGKLTITFDMAATTDAADASVSFMDSDVGPLFRKTDNSHYYAHHSIQVCMAGGVFKAIDGPAWVDGPAFKKDTVYKVRVEADMDAHSYTAYVTAPGQAEALIGENLKFRTRSQVEDDPANDIVPVADDLQFMVVAGNVADQIYMQNLVIKEK
ncbi:MAG: hypothetical protein PHV32_11840 [Eubacteriales bacterium]|nr:hypothetical protein [Eubacteriales bacterium]